MNDSSETVTVMVLYPAPARGRELVVYRLGESSVENGMYKVRATADLIVENGVPLGDPRDFITFKLTEIRPERH